MWNPLATAVKKMVLGASLPQINPEKVPVLISNLVGV